MSGRRRSLTDGGTRGLHGTGSSAKVLNTMARFSQSSAAAALVLGLIATASAQTPPPPPTSAPAPVSPVTAAQADTTANPAAPVAAAEAPPKRTRAISGSVASMLAASMPKYTPPPPPPTPEELAKKAEEEAADLREIDKPKNGIVRLDKVIVREERPAVLAERTINTKQGLRDLAMRRYITDADRALNRYSIPLFSGWSPGSDKGSSTEERALFMYSEDERLKNMADLADNTNMVMKSNAADGAAVKRAAQDTYRRSDDFGWRGNSPR